MARHHHKRLLGNGDPAPMHNRANSYRSYDTDALTEVRREIEERHSMYVLLAGIVLAYGDRPFTDQDLLSILFRLQEGSENLKRRFRIQGTPGDLRSKVVADTLSFMEMYQVLVPSHDHPSHTRYRCPLNMQHVLATFLLEHKVYPKQRGYFRKLIESRLRE